MFDSNTIPAWVVGVFMIWAGASWLISRTRKIRMDSRIFAATLILWGVMYSIVFQFFNLDIEFRAFLSRLMIILVCLSQALPLTISIYRGAKRGY